MKLYNSRKLVLQLSVVIACIIVSGAMMFIVYLYNDESSIGGLAVAQDGYNLHVAWEPIEGTAEYEVVISRGINNHMSVMTNKNSAVIEQISLDQRYIVTVNAWGNAREKLGSADCYVETKKLEQSIECSTEKVAGFVGDDINIEANAKGKITLMSEKQDIADVCGKSVLFKAPGKAYLVISAEETENYASAEEKLEISVYPNTLETPRFFVKSLQTSTVSFRWDQNKNATEYQLLRKNPATSEYDVIKTVEGTRTTTLAARTQGEYALRAVTTIGDKSVVSELSAPISVESSGATVKSYSRAHTLAKLTKSDLDVVALIHGTGNTKVPQSMCFNGSEYIISYVNHSGTVGKFVAYDSQTGELTRQQSAKGMGYANGATYNINNGIIYVAKTHKNYKTAESNIYSEKDFSSQGKFNLPKVTSGIAYDPTNDKYYLSKGNNVYVTDSNFKVERSIYKRARYNHAQDVGGYNGIAFVCTWVNGKESYIDLYRAEDGDYLGSFDVSLGEVESCLVDNGFLVILMNIKGTNDAYIYKTKERIAF